MPRSVLLVVGLLVGWSLACSSEPAGGGGGGGGAAIGAPDDEPEAPPGRGRGKARGGKAGDRERGKRGRGGGRDHDDGEDDGDEEDDPAPKPAPAPAPDGFACYAEGTYRVCATANKPNTCHDETAKAGGPGSTRSAAEHNAVDACNAHLDTLVSAADSGKGSASVKERCKVTTCE